MSHIEHEGKIYCDWRITTEGCEDSQFFRMVYILGLSISSFALPSLLISVAIRKFAFGEPMRLIPTSENGLVLFTFPIPIAFKLHFISILAQWPSLVSGILWAFPDPLLNITTVYYQSFMLKTIPKAVLKQGTSKWELSDQARSYLMFAFSVFLFITHVVIISVAQSYIYYGEVSRGRRLERIGLTITSVNCFLLSLGACYCSMTLKLRVARVLKETLEVSERGVDHTLLKIMLNKLRQHFFTVIAIASMEIIGFLLLAYYPGFFTNLTFSKALAVISMIIRPTNGAIHCFCTAMFDMKKWLYNRRVTERSSRGGSEKKEEGTAPASIRLSIAKNDQVQQIIEDLNTQ